MSDHVLLTAEAHRDLRIRRDRSAALGDEVMTSLLVPDEFRRVQGEYPILFRQNRERNGFTAFAIFGFTTGENLFLEGDRWDASYLPLALDIQPFLIGGSPDAAGGKQAVVDLGSPRIADGEGVRVFDRDGRPTPYLETMLARMSELDKGYRAAAPFFDALAQYDLLEPLILEVTLIDGSTNRLIGFHTIAEDRLRELDGATLGELHSAGHLLPIFMAMASLAKLTTLIERKNRRIRGG
ncbi:SapC family protein [Croceibacterium ferulae]|uniref:SapC family protein n=1 Tax=Croceibacterium ferulae TaxID=1854641 RepID=UPI000EB3FFC2|nr:SapC family protein [Croceibacterium ferulae]